MTKTLAEDRLHVDVLRSRGVEVTLIPAVNEPARPDLSHPGTAYQVLRHRSVDGARVVLPHPFDVVHVEGYYMRQHAPRAPGRTMLVEQNIESQLWRQRAEVEDDQGRHRWMRQEERATAAAERAAWRAADVVGAVTPEDRSAIARVVRHDRIVVVPDGIDHRSGDDGDDDPVLPRPPRVVLVGNYAYEPNVDAATYLVGAILPRMRALGVRPSVLLVGNEPPEEVRRLAADPDVTVTGRVRSVDPYLDSADVVACPLRIGGGVKVKVLEALARGCATVTTSVGAQGLGDAARSALRIADDPDAFAAAVTGLVRDRVERERLQSAAAAAAPGYGTWDDSAALLLEQWHALAGTVTSSASAPGRHAS